MKLIKNCPNYHKFVCKKSKQQITVLKLWKTKRLWFFFQFLFFKFPKNNWKITCWTKSHRNGFWKRDNDSSLIDLILYSSYPNGRKSRNDRILSPKVWYILKLWMLESIIITASFAFFFESSISFSNSFVSEPSNMASPWVSFHFL